MICYSKAFRWGLACHKILKPLQLVSRSVERQCLSGWPKGMLSQSHYRNLLAALHVMWRAVMAQPPFQLLTFTLPLPCFSQILSTESKNQETKGNNILSSQFMKRVCFFLEHKNVPSLWLTWDKMEAKPDPLYSEGTSRASEEHRLRLPHKCCRFTTAQSMHSYGVKYLTARIKTLWKPDRQPSKVSLLISTAPDSWPFLLPLCIPHATVTYFILFYHLRTQVS